MKTPRRANTARSLRDDTHWADQRERGSLMLMRLTAATARHLGRQAIAPIVWLTVLYFYLTGARARRGIAQYQARLVATYPDLRLPRRAPVYRQYLTYAHALLDKLDVWRHRIRLTDVHLIDPDGLHAQMRHGRGQMLVGSHLGNIEICRALADREQKLTLNVLVHDKHARAFNRLLGEAGATHLRLIQVSELTPRACLNWPRPSRAANGFPSLATAFRCLVNAPCTRISWALPRHFHKGPGCWQGYSNVR